MLVARRAPKIAVLGAGSYVFGTSLLHDLIIDHPLRGTQLVLMDRDEGLAVDMAALARRIAGDAGVDMNIESTADRTAALSGADFVTSSMAVDLRRRWEMDRDVIARYAIPEGTGECGGVEGILYALRTSALLLDVAREMETAAPEAWLLNVSNPLPRVVGAVARGTKVKVAGFCNVAQGGYGGYARVARLLGRDMHDINVTSAGLNHLSWLVAVRDRYTRADLMPRVQEALASGVVFGGELTMRCYRDFGALALSGDDHIREFLPLARDERKPRPAAHHGTEDERAQRRRRLWEAATGALPWRAALGVRAWERPADVIDALCTGTQRHLDMVNLPNRGALPELPGGIVVETPAWVRNDRIEAARVSLPAGVVDICRAAGSVQALVAEAAVAGDRQAVEEAIRLDPSISDKPAALAATRELIELHKDVLPAFQ